MSRPDLVFCLINTMFSPSCCLKAMYLLFSYRMFLKPIILLFSVGTLGYLCRLPLYYKSLVYYCLGSVVKSLILYFSYSPQSKCFTLLFMRWSAVSCLRFSSSSQRHRLAFFSHSKSRTHRLDGDIRLYSLSTMASSSDTRSTCVWLEDTHVALRRPRSAQASNERITFVSTLDPRNKQGYDVLLFRPPASTGQKARAVTLYNDRWHELDHDTRSRKPYLGVARPDIHEFDGENLPSDHEPTIEDSDEEPILPRPKSPESSGSEAPTRTLVTYENISRPPTPPNEDSSTQPRYRRSPSPDQYRISFTTPIEEQQPPPSDMAA